LLRPAWPAALRCGTRRLRRGRGDVDGRAEGSVGCEMGFGGFQSHGGTPKTLDGLQGKIHKWFKWWYPNGWFIVENHMKMHDLGVALFKETSIAPCSTDMMEATWNHYK